MSAQSTTSKTYSDFDTSYGSSSEEGSATFHASEHSHVKRRATSPLTLDCQTLQSSMKRVRLSCSPGELRLQRDLRTMESLGWKMLEQLDASLSPTFLPNETVTRWWKEQQFSDSDVLQAELHLQDPLHMVLYLKFSSHPELARMWIQIPRMYPHRPPVILRTEHLWMSKVLVLDAPPSATSFTTDVIGTYPDHVAVYKDWSPVRHLVDLLDFLLKICTTPLAGLPMRDEMVVPCDTSISTNPPTSGCSSPLDSDFDEHKMDDGTSTPRHDNTSPFRSLLECEVFPPNRFDLGYGRYADPIASRGQVMNSFHSFSSSNQVLVSDRENNVMDFRQEGDEDEDMEWI